jgi:acetolactate decarboxylase
MKLLHLLTCLGLISLISCKSQNNDGFEVEYEGALKNIMHKGDLSAKADLAEFDDTEHLYGLGALENLKGEILILDGEAIISTVENGKLKIDNSFDYKASLFVYSSINTWRTFEIPDSITSKEDLEVYVEITAKENGINTDEPFPFLLEGNGSVVDWHVINWPEGDTIHTHEKHINSGLNGTLNNQDLEILGFY